MNSEHSRPRDCRMRPRVVKRGSWAWNATLVTLAFLSLCVLSSVSIRAMCVDVWCATETVVFEVCTNGDCEIDSWETYDIYCCEPVDLPGGGTGGGGGGGGGNPSPTPTPTPSPTPRPYDQDGDGKLDCLLDIYVPVEPPVAIQADDRLGSNYCWSEGQESFCGPNDITECHSGVDLRCNDGTPVHSPVTGTVTHSFLDVADFGIEKVRIDVGGGLFAELGHFSTRAVSVGDQVVPGTVLGLCGHSGTSVSHTHYALFRYDSNANHGCPARAGSEMRDPERYHDNHNNCPPPSEQ